MKLRVFSEERGCTRERRSSESAHPPNDMEEQRRYGDAAHASSRYIVQESHGAQVKLCDRLKVPCSHALRHSAVQLGKPRWTLDARFIGFEACRHVTRDSRETSYALARGLQGRLSQARAPLRVEEGLERRG